MDYLKFRILDVKENNYCDLTRNDVKFFIDTEGELKRAVQYEPTERVPATTYIFENVLPENFKAEFCTGKVDRHGKLMYQGDIVRSYFASADNASDYEDMEVRYDTENLCWVLYDKAHNYADDMVLGDDEYDPRNLEIIGNINTGVKNA